MGMDKVSASKTFVIKNATQGDCMTVVDCDSAWSAEMF